LPARTSRSGRWGRRPHRWRLRGPARRGWRAFRIRAYVAFLSRHCQYAETLARPAPDLQALDRALIQPLVSRVLAGDESIQPGALVEDGAHAAATRVHEGTDIRVSGQLAGKLRGGGD